MSRWGRNDRTLLQPIIKWLFQELIYVTVGLGLVEQALQGIHRLLLVRLLGCKVRLPRLMETQSLEDDTA